MRQVALPVPGPGLKTSLGGNREKVTGPCPFTLAPSPSFNTTPDAAFLMCFSVKVRQESRIVYVWSWVHWGLKRLNSLNRKDKGRKSMAMVAIHM